MARTSLLDLAGPLCPVFFYPPPNGIDLQHSQGATSGFNP
jgi:hypothetical protein